MRPIFYRGDLPLLAMFAAVAVLVLLVAVVSTLKDLIMKHFVFAAALAVAAVAMSGCANVGEFLTTQQADDTVGARILQDIQGCTRTYRGALGTGITGSFEIACDPVVRDGSHLEPAKAAAQALPPL